MTDVPPTPHTKLREAFDIGKKIGLKFIYVGNVEDSERSSTYCPKCKKLLIFRDNYFTQIKNLDLKKGQCKACKEKVYGVWN